MLVAIDSAGLLILLPVENLAVGACEMTVVLGAHATLFLVDTGLLVFEARGLAGCKLTALDTLCDAVLLILFSLIDVVVVLAGGGSCLSKDRGRGKDERQMSASLASFMMTLL